MNNFNKSSNGVSINFECFYDEVVSRCEFEENFKALKSDGNRNLAVYQYTNFEQEKEIEEITDLFDFSKCSSKDFKKWCIDILEGEIKEIISEKVKFYESWEEMFFEKFKEIYDWNTIERNTYDLPENTKELYWKFETIGYNQGEYAFVLISCKLVNEYKGGEEFFKKIIHNYMWEFPIYCRVEIELDKGDNPTQTHEIYVDKKMKDIYSWDKEEAIEIVKSELENLTLPYSHEEKKIIIEFVEQHFPEQPKY